jgi:hypothetical protein
MLAVGIDWAEQFHDIALGRPGQGVFDGFRVEHTPAAVHALIARLTCLEPDPADVRVVIQTSTDCWSRRWSTPGSRCCRSTPT